MSNLAVVSRVTCNEKSLIKGGSEIGIVSHQSITVTFFQSHSIHLILSGRERGIIHVYYTWGEQDLIHIMKRERRIYTHSTVFDSVE
jgi:hypothetical protein